MSENDYDFALTAKREELVRKGVFKPINEAEKRQAAEGWRGLAEMDCVRNFKPRK